MRFGVVRGIDVTETRHIRYTIGAHYGFRVDYHDSGHVMKLRQKFVLPGPAQWKSASPPSRNTQSSDSGRILIREVTLGSRKAAPPEIHSIYIEDLQIASGDPRGEYALHLCLDGKPFRTFHFRVE